MNAKDSWWLLLLCLVMACGSTDAGKPGEPSGSTDEFVSATLDTDLDTRRADAPGKWQVKTDGMTMWVDTVLQPSWSTTGETKWTLRGRVSKTMTGFRAYDASGRGLGGRAVSARKFEVELSADEVLDLVAGEQIYFDFFVHRGSQPVYHGMAQFAPRFAGWAGTSSIYVYRAINPVIVGGDLKFRGRASTRSGFELDLVYTDDDADPALFDDEPNKYHFDWSPAALHLAADPPDDPVWFRGSDSASTPVEKSASVQFRLIRMGIGTESPSVAWPTEQCDPQVRHCLVELEDPDTEVCGWANQVEPCIGVIDLPVAADPDRFAGDLRKAVTDWYDEHETEVRALGGRTLQASLDAIDPDRVGRVNDAEVDLLGWDPAHFDAFYHVDPVFPRSDRIWYGVYDHGGTLMSMETVN